MTKEQTEQILTSGNPKDPHYYTAWNLVMTAIENLTGCKRVLTGQPQDEPAFVLTNQMRFTIPEALTFVKDTIT